MTIRTAVKALIPLTMVMMVQAFVLTFWCESASIFSFRVEDSTPLSSGGEVLKFPLFELKSTIPGFLDFSVILILLILILKQKRLHIFGVEVTPQHFGLIIVGLTVWNLLFAAYLVAMEFKLLVPCYFCLSFDVVLVAQAIVIGRSFFQSYSLPRLKSFSDIDV